MTKRSIIGAGLGVGFATFLIIGGLSGQYVPPTGWNTSLLAGSGLTTSNGALNIGAGAGLTSTADTVDVVATSGGFLTVGADSVGITPCTNPGERPEWDGTAWQCRVRNDYRGTHLEWSEEFLVNTPGNTDIFAQVLSGAGTQAVVATSSRPGVIGYETGSTTTGRAARRTSDSVIPGAWTTTTYQFTGCVPVLSTSGEEYTVVIGTHDTDTATATDGCYFLYDRGNVHTGGCNSGNAHNWQAVATNNSNRTVVLLDGTSQDGACGAGSITTVAATAAACSLPDTGFHTYEVIQSGTTSCVFKRDGTTVATLTTNIPDATRATRAKFGILKSNGGTTTLLYADRHRLAIDLSAARSP